MLDQAEALQILKELLTVSNRSDTDFIIELSDKGHFWIIRPTDYDEYGTGLGCWLIDRETKEVEALNPHVDPNLWEEIYLDAQDADHIWIIRFDQEHKKGLIKFKNLLGVALSEAKSIADKQHWFQGHRVQLVYIRDLLRQQDISTCVEKVPIMSGIKKLKEFPYEGFFLEDIIKMIKLEPTHWWE